MLPTGRVAVPVFEGFFQMELDGVDELIFRTLDHHLIATQVRAGQQLKSFRHAIELQSVVLPDAQNATLARVILPDARLRSVDAVEAWIFSDAVRAGLLLFLLVEREGAGAEAQPDQLMSSADA